MEHKKNLDIAALLALISISATQAVAVASETTDKRTSSNGTMWIAENKAGSAKGADSACGKGSCGADMKGAAAAADKHAKESKSEPSKSAAKTKAPAASDKTKKSAK